MNFSCGFVCLLVYLCVLTAQGQSTGFIRPPAVPLVVVNPFFSIWSANDNFISVYDGWTQNGPNGEIQSLVGIVRVDGVPMRFMGGCADVVPAVMQQISVQVNPRQTIYVFAAHGVQLTVTFTTPIFPEETNFEFSSRPVTYVTFDVISIDGALHDVQVYYDNSGELVASSSSENVSWNRYIKQNIATLKMGLTNQNPLSGTNDIINWGFIYVATPDDAQLSQTCAGASLSRNTFCKSGEVAPMDMNQPRAINDDWPVVVNVWNLGKVGTKEVSKYLILAYDEIEAINYFGQIFPPYWKRFNESMDLMLQNSTRDYETIISMAISSDSKLLNELSQVGGNKYAELTSLIFRQTFGGNNFVYNSKLGKVWYFLKEISSCGCLQTVDVIFPMSPILLYLNPQLLYLQLEPLLEYANNATNIPYNLAWAPHHLGSYPIGNITPDQQEQMPVEETGNFFLMLAGIAQKLNSTSFIPTRYWKLLDNWALYLNTTALDPGNQLCTDDFEGPSPHNANLAAKGILGLTAYSILAAYDNRHDVSAYWLSISKDYANSWIQKSIDTDGIHSKLEYDLSNTWSLKYNLLWQKLLGVSVFPVDVFVNEEKYYLTKHNVYGIPLDNRASFSKSDWNMWIAAMVSRESFDLIVDSVYSYANKTTSRVPLSDWYETVSGEMKGFRCRPVQGAFFAKMIAPSP